MTNRVEAVGTEAKEMLGPHARQHRRDPADEGRRHRRLRGHREDARSLHQEGARPLALRAAAHRHLACRRASPRSRSARCTTRRCAPARREVFLIEQAMAAAIGAGLPITEPSGNMIVDIGGGTTDVAVISLAGIVYSRSVRVAGERDGRGDHPVPQAQVQPADRRAHRRADQDRDRLGVPARRAADDGGQGPRPRRGRAEDARRSPTRRSARRWPRPWPRSSRRVRVALERTPPELSADIMDKGIVLTGGGSLLRNLDRRLSRGDRPADLLRRGPARLGGARHRARCSRTWTC